MEQITALIDVKLLIFIVMSSLWYKKVLSVDITNLIAKVKWLKWLSLTHQIFLWSTIICGLYAFISYKTGLMEIKEWANYAVTYFAATSFYDLLWRPIEDFFVKKFGKKQDA